MTMLKTLKALKNHEQKQLAATGILRGYYLIRSSDGARFYISKDVDVVALERVADKALSDKTGYEYTIGYSHGLDVHGNHAWSQFDHTDRFI